MGLAKRLAIGGKYGEGAEDTAKKGHADTIQPKRSRVIGGTTMRGGQGNEIGIADTPSKAMGHAESAAERHGDVEGALIPQSSGKVTVKHGQTAGKNPANTTNPTNPLTSTGKRVLASMQKQYGAEKGKQVFHASIKAKKPGSRKWHK